MAREILKVEGYVSADRNRMGRQLELKAGGVGGGIPCLPQLWDLGFDVVLTNDFVRALTQPQDPERTWVKIKARVPRGFGPDYWRDLIALRWPGVSEVEVIEYTYPDQPFSEQGEATAGAWDITQPIVSQTE